MQGANSTYSVRFILRFSVLFSSFYLVKSIYIV